MSARTRSVRRTHIKALLSECSNSNLSCLKEDIARIPVGGRGEIIREIADALGPDHVAKAEQKVAEARDALTKAQGHLDLARQQQEADR